MGNADKGDTGTRRWKKGNAGIEILLSSIYTWYHGEV